MEVESPSIQGTMIPCASALAIGIPVRQTMDTMLKHMPVHTLITLIRVVRPAQTAGKRPCTLVAKTSYMMRTAKRSTIAMMNNTRQKSQDDKSTNRF